MQREIEALIRAWQLDRQEEERALVQICKAFSEFASVRERLFADLAVALAPRHPQHRANVESDISDVLRNLRQQDQRYDARYN